MFLNYLKGFAEASALYSDDPEFETLHLENVVLHAMHLSKKRNLDEKVVAAIAMGHDLGRTHLGVHGKDHAKAGSKLMKRLLEESDFNEDEKTIICSAIKHHSQKSKIHNEYDELIKDADALAHKDDGILSEENLYEQYRISAINCEPIDLTLSAVSDWVRIYRDQVDLLKESYLDFEKRSEHPALWVHEIRTGIRKIRALLRFLAPSDVKIQRKLKKWSNELSEARFLYVATLKSDKLSPKVNEKLKKLYMELGSKFTQDKIDKRVKRLDMSFNDEKIVSDSLAVYQQMVMNINYKKLHKLRIEGKTFKYLTQLGLMDLSPQEMVDVILRLHDLIGDYNDYLEMAHYFKDSRYKDEAEKLMNSIQMDIFFLQKIILCCTTTKNVRYN